MLRHSYDRAVNFFVAALINPALDLMTYLPSRRRREVVREKKGAFKCFNETQISSLIQMCGVHSFVNPRPICPDFVKHISINWSQGGKNKF